MLDINEAARVAHRSPETIRRWVWSGKLAARRHGRRLMISRDDLAHFIAPSGTGMALSLAEWAVSARATLTRPGQPSLGSAADLVLADRLRRSETRVDH
ncbi:MAG: helix-turn-helix domain-containing protein [Acidimicrobiales bacterium]